MCSYHHQEIQSAWVVFTGKTDIFWLRFLKSGFRHCYVLLNDGHSWICIDPVSTYTDVQVYHDIPANYNFPKWLELSGYRVTPATINKNHFKPAPLMWCSCVEFVKRILGIHKCSVVTPWQLYKFLQKIN